MNYPIGTYNDPRAPWNETGNALAECTECGGKGYHWHLTDTWDNTEMECGEDEWNDCPATESEAAELGESVVRGRVDQCPFCCGTGMC